ncbi:MAG: ABC transporter permease [Spirochaetaceae bacterium]|nr:ABC transporter permease [Spirochaetaceae bacterium]
MQVTAVNYVPYGTVYWEQRYRDYDITGGLFLQKATHDLDYLMYLLGQPITRVSRTAATACIPRCSGVFPPDTSRKLQRLFKDRQTTGSTTFYSAVRQYTAADYVGRSVAVMGLATPNFWLGTMVMIYPAIWWAWSPPMELIPLAQDPLGNLGMFLIPSLILGTYLAASTMRMTRTMMLEVLRQDYIRTAWAKGLLERSVILRHAVKNAIIPVVTLVGMQLPILVGGSVIIENIFNLPGLGRLMLDALGDRDYPVVSAVNLFFATVVVVVNLVTDLLYASLDPRIRYE